MYVPSIVPPEGREERVAALGGELLDPAGVVAIESVALEEVRELEVVGRPPRVQRLMGDDLAPPDPRAGGHAGDGPDVLVQEAPALARAVDRAEQQPQVEAASPVGGGFHGQHGPHSHRVDFRAALKRHVDARVPELGPVVRPSHEAEGAEEAVDCNLGASKWEGQVARRAVGGRQRRARGRWRGSGARNGGLDRAGGCGGSVGPEGRRARRLLRSRLGGRRAAASEEHEREQRNGRHEAPRESHLHDAHQCRVRGGDGESGWSLSLWDHIVRTGSTGRLPTGQSGRDQSSASGDDSSAVRSSGSAKPRTGPVCACRGVPWRGFALGPRLR